MAFQQLPVQAAEFVSTDDVEVSGEIIRLTESTVTIRPTGGSMIMFAPDDLKLIRYSLNDGSTIEGTLHDWRDGIYVLEASEQLISAKDGAVLSKTALPRQHDQQSEIVEAGANRPAVDHSDPNALLELEAKADVTSEEAKELVFDISSSRPWAEDIIILFATLGGTAKAGRDFESKNGIIRLSAGETRAQLAIPLIDDDEAEADEQLTLFLSSAVDVATIPKRKIVATIRDND